MRQLSIGREAQADLLAAVRWYVAQNPELGRAFRSAVRAALASASEQPLRYRCAHREVRVIRLRRFPYREFFVAEPDRLLVVAVLHVRRPPSVWQQRPIDQ